MPRIMSLIDEGLRLRRDRLGCIKRIFFEAVEQDSLQVVQYLMQNHKEAGLSIPLVSTALCLASSSGKATYLLEKGADPCARVGRELLYPNEKPPDEHELVFPYLIRRARFPDNVVCTIIDKAPNSNRLFDIGTYGKGSRYRLSPLYSAALSGHAFELLSLTEERGFVLGREMLSDVFQLRGEIEPKLLPKLQRMMADPSLKPLDMAEWLQTAVFPLDYSRIESKSTAWVNREHQWSPLIAAMRLHRPKKAAEIIKLLILAGADPKLTTSWKGKMFESYVLVQELQRYLGKTYEEFLAERECTVKEQEQNNPKQPQPRIVEVHSEWPVYLRGPEESTHIANARRAYNTGHRAVEPCQAL